MAQSIIQKERECYLCGRTEPLHLHHCLEGSFRKVADKYGLTVYLCPSCHMRIHGKESAMAFLRKIAQRRAMDFYKWDEWEFIRRIGRSFL